MRKIFINLVYLGMALLILSSIFAHPAEDSNFRYKVGIAQRTIIPQGSYNWRGAKTHALICVVWYPADSGAIEKDIQIGQPGNPIAYAGNASANAKLISSSKKYPLIALSHGTGGSALMMGWLGTELASQGYMVVAVNHPGNNSLEPYTVQGFTLWWERARDLSTVISAMIADSVFGKLIDPARIGAAGFSLGGYTMIELAGGISDPKMLTSYCNSHPSNPLCSDPPEFPGMIAQINNLAASDSVYQSALQHAGDSYDDPRIRAVFAIAPALGPAIKNESLKKITIPVEIVAGAGDTIVSVLDNAEYFAKNIPGSILNIFPGGVGHYTFLALCTDFGKQAVPGICTDAPGVNREEIHRKTVELALKFFKERLK